MSMGDRASWNLVSVSYEERKMLSGLVMFVHEWMIMVRSAVREAMIMEAVQEKE